MMNLLGLRGRRTSEQRGSGAGGHFQASFNRFIRPGRLGDRFGQPGIRLTGATVELSWAIRI